MTSTFSFTIAASVLLAASAAAEETVLTIDGGPYPVAATLNLPETAGMDAPVVLLLHGFTGSRDELPVATTELGVFSYTAAALADAGIPSLRIDFSGSGDSTGIAWADTTFSTQIADAVAVIDHVRADDVLGQHPLVVLGWSQGGLVAAHAAAARPDIDGLVLWAAVADPMLTYGLLGGKDLIVDALGKAPDEIVSMTLPWGATTELKVAFFQEMPVTLPVAAVASYSGPLQVVVGSEDTVVTPQPQAGEVYLRYHDGPEELHILPMDHAFAAFTGTEKLDEMLGLLTGFIGSLDD